MRKVVAEIEKGQIVGLLILELNKNNDLLNYSVINGIEDKIIEKLQELFGDQVYDKIESDNVLEVLDDLAKNNPDSVKIYEDMGKIPVKITYYDNKEKSSFVREFLSGERSKISKEDTENFIEIYKNNVDRLYSFYEELGLTRESLFEHELLETKSSAINNKIRITNLNLKKIVAIVTAGATLVTLGVAGNCYFRNRSKQNVPVDNNTTLENIEPPIMPTPVPTDVPIAEPTSVPTAEPTMEPTLEPTSIPTAEPTMEPTPVPTSVPTAEPVITPTITPYPVRYNPEDSQALADVYRLENGEYIKFQVNVWEDYSSYANITDNQDIKSYSTALQMTDINVSDLASYIFTPQPEYYSSLQNKTAAAIHFEKFISQEDQISYNYVKYFSDLRNELIYKGYEENNFDGVRECGNYAAREAIRLITNDEPLSLNINGTEQLVRYSSLPDVTKQIVLSLTNAYYIILGNDNFEYNGEIYNQERLGVELYNLEKEPTPTF